MDGTCLSPRRPRLVWTVPMKKLVLCLALVCLGVAIATFAPGVSNVVRDLAGLVVPGHPADAEAKDPHGHGPESHAHSACRAFSRDTQVHIR